MLLLPPLSLSTILKLSLPSSPEMLRPRRSIHSKPEGKSSIDDEDRSVEQEDVELNEVLLSYALGSPRTVMVIPNHTHITVAAVEGLRRHIKPTLPTKPKLSQCLRCPVQSSLLFLTQRVGNAGITQGNHQIGQTLSNAYDIRDYDDVDILDVVGDVSDEEKAYEGEDYKSWEKAKIFIREVVQSGPSVRVINGLSIIFMWFPNFLLEICCDVEMSLFYQSS